MCLYPTLIQNPKYKRNKKNGGNIPPIIDPRVTQLPIGCGDCIECRKQKQRQWHVRLLEEIKSTPHGYFVTLTFSDESIASLATGMSITGYTLDNAIATRATRLFLERWRKKHKKSLQHWFVTELGHQGTQNIHLHGIIWTKEKNDIIQLNKYWQYGYTWTGNYVNQATVNYIVKYVSKVDKDHPNYKQIVLTSPAIGKKYLQTKTAELNKFNGENTKDTYRSSTGHKIALPIYYRNKIYTETERELLWLHKLDQKKRYILGQEIDMTTNTELYLNLLKVARQKNARLGYGNPIIKNYQQKEYEKQLRIQMQMTRIYRAKQKNIDTDIKQIDTLKNEWLRNKLYEAPF